VPLFNNKDFDSLNMGLSGKGKLAPKVLKRRGPIFWFYGMAKGD